MLMGTFFRGPNWSFFGFYETWDVHKVEVLNNVQLSERFWTDWLGRALPRAPVGAGGWSQLGYIVLREAAGPRVARRLLRRAARGRGAPERPRGSVPASARPCTLRDHGVVAAADGAAPDQDDLPLAVQHELLGVDPGVLFQFLGPMPATDQTCYNMKRLHKAFALSSVLLLCATIWMFAVDHRRPWKSMQCTSDRIAARMTEWRKLQVLTDDVLAERERLQQALAELQSKDLPSALVAAFHDEVRQDARRREAPAPSFVADDELMHTMQTYAASAQAAQRVAGRCLDVDKDRLEVDDAAARVETANAADRERLLSALRELRDASDQARAGKRKRWPRRQAEAAVAPAARQSWRCCSPGSTRRSFAKRSGGDSSDSNAQNSMPPRPGTAWQCGITSRRNCCSSCKATCRIARRRSTG